MKIAIAGYGIEGEANYAYWSRDPANELTIVDESDTPKHPLPEGVPTILGAGAFEKLNGFDLVIRTAGLSPYKIKTDGKIWSATNEFFEKCVAPIIGVTGTKGKGTTTSLIAAMIEAAGKKVWLVGNIGTAALDILDQVTPDDVVAFEMSSFQLWDIERSPHVAVVLRIEADHLNVHRDMEDYVGAKGNIRKFQGYNDVCIYYPGNYYSRTIALTNSVGKAVPYTVGDNGGVYIEEGQFRTAEQIICSVAELQLIGDHNKENACAAISAALEMGTSTEAIAQGLRTFKGLSHRTEFVRELEDVQYYNDSFSSAPSATIAAVRSFTQPEIVILGGTDKGSDFNELAEVLKEKSNIKELIVVGEIRHKLSDLLREHGVATTVFGGQTMPEIVDYARQQAVAGDVVILSPGCASFDMFRDFYDRGDQFRIYVNSL